MKERFFCISYYQGSLDIIKHTRGNYIVYFKGEANKGKYDQFKSDKKKLIENSGFNIATYLIYIIDNYSNLPEVIVFCKNNIYPRHVTEKTFERLVWRDVFTPLVEPKEWRVSFPIKSVTSAQDYLEINDSWYSKNHEGRYFKQYDDFFEYLFPTAVRPVFNRFTPGANFVVPKENVLQRTRSFYQNLLSFIEYETHSVESYFVERALDTIFTSSLDSNQVLNSTLGHIELEELRLRNTRTKGLKKFSGRSIARKVGYALIQWIYFAIFNKQR